MIHTPRGLALGAQYGRQDQIAIDDMNESMNRPDLPSPGLRQHLGGRTAPMCAGSAIDPAWKDDGSLVLTGVGRFGRPNPGTSPYLDQDGRSVYQPLATERRDHFQNVFTHIHSCFPVPIKDLYPNRASFQADSGATFQAS